MAYTFLADLTVLVHLGFVVFVAVGGFVAWRRPRVLRAHLPAVGWALGIVTIGWPCPLTLAEKQLRSWGGVGGYPGAFLDRYVTGVLYPARYAQVAQAMVAVAILTSYAGLWLSQRRRTGRSAVAPMAATAATYALRGSEAPTTSGRGPR